MIKEEITFDEQASKPTILWCGQDNDKTTLAGAVAFAIENNFEYVSVVPGAVGVVWPWTEKTKIKILSGFYAAENADWSAFVRSVKDGFIRGADGAQIFIQLKCLDDFVDAISPVCDDLFFGKTLSVGLDIDDVNALDWEHLFDCLIKLQADSLTIVLTKDLGDKSDFVGRITTMFDLWPDTYNGGLVLKLGDSEMRNEQVWRLAQSMRPNINIKIIQTYKN